MMLLSVSTSAQVTSRPRPVVATGVWQRPRAAPAATHTQCCRRRPACSCHDARSGSHQYGGACAAGAWTCGMGLSIRKPLLQRLRMTKNVWLTCKERRHFAQPHCHIGICKGTLHSHIATCGYEVEDPCAAALATKGPLL